MGLDVETPKNSTIFLGPFNRPGYVHWLILLPVSGWLKPWYNGTPMCFLMAKQLNMLTPNKEVVTLKFMGDPHHFINVQKVEFRLAFGKLLHNY
jgi:hypothetical protein